MEAVAADTVPPIQMIWNGVKVSPLRNRMVKRRVEHRDLRSLLAEKSRAATMPLMLLGLWSGPDRCTPRSPATPCRRSTPTPEQLAAMDDAMPNGVNVARALDLRDARFVGRDVANQVVQCR